MLYKFKSKAAADLIMLEPSGRRILQIIGKDSGEGDAVKGILLPEEMAAAIAALRASVAQDEAARGNATAAGSQTVSLRQRAVPFIEMLQRCEKAGKEIVWGV